jgi:hypothetical protein
MGIELLIVIIAFVGLTIYFGKPCDTDFEE